MNEVPACVHGRWLQCPYCYIAQLEAQLKAQEIQGGKLCAESASRLARIWKLEAALRKMRQFAFIDRWGGKGFDDEAQSLYDEVTDIVCFGMETK
jgi:hypothetical protein